MREARNVLTWAARLYLVALVVQFFFAGAAAFGAESWDLHQGFGLALVAASLVLLILAAMARLALIAAAGLFGAMILQMVLAQLGDTSGWLAALHAVNALAVIGLASMVAARAGRGRATAS